MHCIVQGPYELAFESVQETLCSFSKAMIGQRPARHQQRFGAQIQERRNDQTL